MEKRGIPKGIIEWVVDQLPVHYTDSDICDDLRRRFVPVKHWPEERIQRALAYAVAVHHRNQRMAIAVDCGALFIME